MAIATPARGLPGTKAHPERRLAFFFREIIGRGYLVDEYKSGDDRYKWMR